MLKGLQRMLKIENLVVQVDRKTILHGINLTIEAGETHALLGPNGSGKTTLLMAIMGIPRYRINSGRVIFDGKDITKLSIDKRARLGIGLAFQRPPAVRGIKTEQILEICLKQKDEEKVIALTQKLNLTEMLGRDINQDFSGGELKRSEMLQLLAQSPSFAMFDEPESGVDLDNIALVGEAMNEILGKERVREKKRAGIIVTHTGHILNYVNADKGHVLMEGKIVCAGNPRDLFADIRAYGYEGCVKCRKC